MENTFRHTELTFQLIVESSPNAIVLVNKEGKIAYINNQTEKLFHYTRTELIGREVEILLPKRYTHKHPEFRQMFFNTPVVRAMGAGRELFALRKDNTEFPIEIGLTPLVTVDGTLVLASIIDITERKKAEDRFRLVVELSPYCMVLVNKEGVITLVNKQTEILFGYERNELMGQKLEILIPHRFSKEHPGYRKQFFKDLKNRPMGPGKDLFARRKDGSEVPVEIGLNPIETTDGQMVLASVIDITERKHQEATLKKQIELETKNKELEQFAYIASHDLQEPLRTVSNYMQIFEEDYFEQLDTNAHNYIRSVKNATQRMSMLVKALLHYSRLGRDKKLTHSSLQVLVSTVIADLKTVIDSSGAIIEIGNLPELNVFETELRQLFQNLITNAIKFKRKNQTPHIQINAEKSGDLWYFSVRDNGIGIKPEHFGRIFEIFQRLNPGTEYEGNGIGLANCKKIVEIHKGDIWIESALGEGSTFFFTIPELNEHELQPE